MIKTTMVATLGGQPQVITLALDALLAQREAVHEVLVLHFSAQNPRTRQSLMRLAAEFNHDLYQGQPVRFRPVQITHGIEPLYDIQSEREAEITWQFVRSLIAELKNQDRSLHLCIAGGRRMLAMLVTTAAALLCDHRDRLWHIYTPDSVRVQVDGGARMHVDPQDGVRLIQVPLVPWGTYFPALRAMAQTPERAVAEQLGILTAMDEVRCRRVFSALTPRQQQTLCAFAQGLTPHEVAEQLSISLSTVNTHKTAILSECRITWDFVEEKWLDYHFLREHFALFCQTLS
jgi:CRISPR-associated protein Csx14